MNINQPYPLVLASSSPYRQELLSRLGLPFVCISPAVEETPLSNESGVDLVMRLSRQKAQAVSKTEPGAVVIGSDQVAMLDDLVLTKPGTHEQAHKQLQQLSGRQVIFHTGLCVLCPNDPQLQTDCINFPVTFRNLQNDEIERYLNEEQPYDCAGSFKSEGLGISLLEKMGGEDPTALIGLPLIRLCEMLRSVGFRIP